MIRRFHVTAFWDPEAKVWCSETDIFGLVIETRTLDEFEEVMDDLAPEMIELNHLEQAGSVTTNERETIVIVWERPPIKIAREYAEAA